MAGAMSLRPLCQYEWMTKMSVTRCGCEAGVQGGATQPIRPSPVSKLLPLPPVGVPPPELL